MGNIVGGLIGGIGSLLGGSSAKSNDLTGYNYLNANPANKAAQGAVAPAVAGQTGALTGQSGVADTMNTLLTSNGTNTPAFQNYLNSTGYNFKMDQGQRAITGSAAAKGLLGSGSTAKALTTFGQGLAGDTFNNYLSQLRDTAGVYGSNATGYGAQAQTGVGAAGQVAANGTEGGRPAGDATQTGTTNFFGKLVGAATSLIGL